MIALIIIKIFLIILAGLFNACMDVLSKNRYFDSIFVKWKFFKKYQNFLNPLTSASNKWKNGDNKQGEKFLGSSTFLVWLTDGWHFCKTCMLLCFAISLCINTIIISIFLDWFIYLIIFGCSFEFFFRKLRYIKIFKYLC